MDRIKVQFVKYDMTKTKNRKRKDMLVDAQNEQAVITQLERIHKGEKVVKVYEIVWDEKQIEEVVQLQKKEIIDRVYGVVKYFNQAQGFGFIKPDEELGEDLFFHKTACVDGIPDEGSTVEFLVSEGPKGLCAVKVRMIEDEY